MTTHIVESNPIVSTPNKIEYQNYIEEMRRERAEDRKQIRELITEIRNLQEVIQLNQEHQTEEIRTMMEEIQNLKEIIQQRTLEQHTEEIRTVVVNPTSTNEIPPTAGDIEVTREILNRLTDNDLETFCKKLSGNIRVYKGRYTADKYKDKEYILREKQEIIRIMEENLERGKAEKIVRRQR